MDGKGGGRGVYIIHYVPMKNKKKINIKCVNRTKQTQKLKISLIGLFPLRVETEVHAQKKVTSLPGAIAPLKMDILTPNKV